MALLVRFDPTAYDKPMEALKRFKQTSTMVTYKAHYESISNRLKRILEKYKLDCFLSDLKDEIRLSIRMLNPLI